VTEPLQISLGPVNLNGFNFGVHAFSYYQLNRQVVIVLTYTSTYLRYFDLLRETFDKEIIHKMAVPYQDQLQRLSVKMFEASVLEIFKRAQELFTSTRRILSIPQRVGCCHGLHGRREALLTPDLRAL
jgi:hypothetical protein